MELDTEAFGHRRDEARPDFSTDPHGWLEAIRDDLHARRTDALIARVEPATWVNASRDGHAWRVVRTADGFELRPELTSPFLRHGESPIVTAIAIGADDVSVELSCRSGRWVDRFPVGAFDVVGLAHAMLEEQSLPHDNLPTLFPLPGT